MTDTIEAKLRAAMEGVTRGEWQVTPTPGADGEPMFVILAQPHPAMRGFTKPLAWAEEPMASFITLCSPDNISALLDENKALRHDIERCVKASSDMATENTALREKLAAAEVALEVMQAALTGIVRLIDIIHKENADKGHILPTGPTVVECRRLANLQPHSTTRGDVK